MPVHPKLQEIIEQTKKANLPPQRKQSISQVREAFMRLRLFSGEEEQVVKLTNETIPGLGGDLSIRLYYPIKKEKLPVLLYFHPGGFVKGDLDSHDPICRLLANRSNALVISVGYRLAPENHFPAPIEDGLTALRWVFDNADAIGADKNKIAVGGESSGGNIAAVLTFLAKRKEHLPICFQLLIYPALDFTLSYPSHKEMEEGYLLEEDSIKWYKELYLNPGDDPKNLMLSPIWAKDFSGLPPAFIITSEYDPLRDEGEAYAEKLKNSGVEVTLERYEGMTHGFFQMPGILDAAEKAINEAAKALKHAYGRGAVFKERKVS